MSNGSFDDGLRFLAEAVGRGKLTGSLEVDQVYAHYQHEGIEFHHPDGGQAMYLRDPLFSRHSDYMKHMASEVIVPEGSQLTEAMIGNMEDLNKQVEVLAPREFEDLARSGHPKVISDATTVYDRPPVVARLTEEELRLKQRISRIIDPNRYKR